MNEIVLDASALLAFLNQEPGSEVLESLLSHSFISTVNLAEVITKLEERGLWTEQSQTDRIWTQLAISIRIQVLR